MKKSNKILVIKHGAFGDLVQADGALRDIRKAYPEAEIVLLTTPGFCRLMARCPHIDRILPDARAPAWKLGALIALARTLRAEQFERVFDLQKSGRCNYYRRFILPDVVWSGRRSEDSTVSQIESFPPQLRRAGVAVTHSLAPDVSWMADDVSDVLAAHQVGRPFVALIPGCAARHPHKRWPYYAQLAEKLLAQGLDVVTAPGPDELELARTLPGHTLLMPDRYLNWFELAGVLRSADFVVGNDTGPSHVAACLNRPGVALFGPHTSAERTGIRRNRFDAIEVADLGKLSPDTVFDQVIAKMRAQENSV